MKNVFLILFLIYSTSNLCATNLPKHVKEFLRIALPLATSVEEEYGVPIALTLAVASYESGYGRSYNATERNNFFGVKSRKTESGWREFKSPEASFKAFGKLLNNERYKTLREIDTDSLFKWCTKLSSLGYNKKPTYAPMLFKLINLWDYDKLNNTNNIKIEPIKQRIDSVKLELLQIDTTTTINAINILYNTEHEQKSSNQTIFYILNFIFLYFFIGELKTNILNII